MVETNSNLLPRSLTRVAEEKGSLAEEKLASFNIAGDPNQAIGVNELRVRRGLLLFLRFVVRLLDIPNPDYDNIQKVLENAFRRLIGRYLSILETIHRIPHSSELPISHGFYQDLGILRSSATVSERLTGLGN